MNTQRLITWPLTLLACFSTLFSFATGGTIQGRVTDARTNDGASNAYVMLICQGVQKTYEANDSGYYYASNIPAGNYTVIVSYMSSKDTATDIRVANDEIQEVNFVLGKATANILDSLVISDTKRPRKPLLDKFEPVTQTLTRDDLKIQPIKSITEALENLAGVVGENGTYYVHGSREGGMAWYIDNCRVMGNPNIPICGVELFRVYDNFIPAKYGDTTGGVTVVETRSLFTE